MRLHVYQPGRSAAMLPASHADTQLAMLSRAAFLVVRGGPDVAMDALVTSEKLFVTLSLQAYTDNKHNRWLLHSVMLIGNNGDAPVMRAIQHVLAGMDRVMPSCFAFVQFGAGEAEMQVCVKEGGWSITTPMGAVPSGRKRKLSVLASGCGNKSSFEQSLFALSHCSLQLCDCTAPCSIPSDLRDRGTVQSLCLSNSNKRSDGGGTTNDIGAMYVPLRDMMKIRARAGGLHGSWPKFMKINVEEYEMGKLTSLVSAASCAELESQILAEFHAQPR